LRLVILIGNGPPTSGSVKNDVALLQKNILPKRIEILGELNPEQVAMTVSQADLLFSPSAGR
jgi:hypothetical protein